MILHGSYANGFAPRDGMPLYPSLWRGCVGAWAPCLGPTGLTLRDWSGRQNHGSLTNMDPETDWTIDSGRYALDLDGSNDRIATSATTLPMTTDFTISCTANVRVATSGCFVAKTNLSSQWDFDLYYTSSTLRFYGDSLGTINSTHTVLTGTSHYCVMRQGSTISFFVNGLLVSSGTNSTALNNGSLPVQIGDETVRLNGSLKSIELYRRALTVSEVFMLSRRPGIIYELALRRRASVAVQFNRRRRLLVGAGS